MSRRADPFKTSLRHTRGKDRKRRPGPIPLLLISTGFAACLGGGPDDVGDETRSVGADAEQAALSIAAVTLPPGAIVDTQPNSGWTEGSFSVNHNGAAEYSLPLWNPAGRRGLQPTLSLHYNSQSGGLRDARVQIRPISS